MSNTNNNMFEAVLTNVQSVEKQYLGPTYKYYENINTPSEIGMSPDGTRAALANDVTGLISYVQLLVEGSGKASKTGKPLGNKFFLKTGAKCRDTKTGQDADRYLYINNVPQGNIPLVTNISGVNFSTFKGLIPGTISNLNTFNPYTILQSFMAGTDCQEITMQTIDVNNNKSSETHYVTLVDIQNTDPCLFPNRKNPVSGSPCRETFTSNINHTYDENEIKMPKDPIVQIYYGGLALLAIYCMYKIVSK